MFNLICVAACGPAGYNVCLTCVSCPTLSCSAGQQGEPAGFAEGAHGLLQDVVVSERRFQYDAEVTRSPMNYDAWFDYVRLEESAGDPARVREVRYGSDKSLAMKLHMTVTIAWCGARKSQREALLLGCSLRNNAG